MHAWSGQLIKQRDDVQVIKRYRDVACGPDLRMLTRRISPILQKQADALGKALLGGLNWSRAMGPGAKLEIGRFVMIDGAEHEQDETED